MSQYRAVPITLAEADRFVEQFHRHNGGLPAAKFTVAAVDSAGLVHGVVIAGLAKARLADGPGVLEVNRVCTDGSFNCCSFLYARIVRAARALGYVRLITYTLATEPGTSLKASGWGCEGAAGGGSWARANRPPTSAAGEAKVRWSISLDDDFPVLVWPTMDEPQTQLSWEAAA